MFTALLPALLLGVTAPADDPASAELTFTQAELATAAGAEAVYDRIARTAQRVCAEENRHSPMSATATRLCVSDTIARTLDQVAAPQLRELGSLLPRPEQDDDPGEREQHAEHA